jgi:glycosyltransferase involved in cell wall biosynthesis
VNILFLTLVDFKSIQQEGIYTDLMREFTKNNHYVYIVSPTEKHGKTHIIAESNCEILKLSLGEIQKTSFIKKGINTLTLEHKVKVAVKRYFSSVKFDLIIYATPPITFYSVVKYIKEKDNAKSYLLLKDIFPQNAIDLGILKKSGLKGLIYRYFRFKERKLYEISDYIGCMSQANVDFVIKHNPTENPLKVHVNPNSIELKDYEHNIKSKLDILEEYNIPTTKTLFIYGGNLGKPQGVDFLIDCLIHSRNDEDIYFIIIGSGTEYSKLKSSIDANQLNNVKLISYLPKSEYDQLVLCSDCGLIFLDIRFTIPNFPSRLLSYMHASLPVIAATDINTDIGKVIEEGKFGYWCESSNEEDFYNLVCRLKDNNLRKELSMNSRNYLEQNYSSSNSYSIIMSHVTKEI